MSEPEGGEHEFPILSPELQVRFWTRLEIIRKELLADSLAQVVREADITQLDHELAGLVGKRRLASLAAYMLRGEVWYPVPYLLRQKPMLLGYYRLLYGISQKEFYNSKTFGRFKALESDNRLSPAGEAQLLPLCRSLIETAWMLFQDVQPISAASIHELQLLTLGPQLRGSENNAIGQTATVIVFDLIGSLVKRHVVSSDKQVIVLRNAAQRIVRIAFAADPDIAIIEAMPSGSVTKVSIEIKGGGDVSNVHNRLGEAEKSHQKAKLAGCTQFWTIVKARVPASDAAKESPTTTEFFRLDDILDRNSSSHQRFRDLLFLSCGIG